ncbi:alpha/beta hydrolase [Brytella acorum]|uniref:Alpha/beta hydrolase n=1 Tax=Brytella acorum TaxID=2959299 RepID=A0AA35XX28_9PROT|nr:alpha/beta hydrolase [Brytella acorum]CAI9119855.1 alpha/beta hydrolase [Brytella acorum]
MKISDQGDPRALVDPALLPFLDLLPAGDVTAETLAWRRSRMRDLVALQERTQDGLAVSVTESHVPGSEGAADVRVLVVAPKTGGAGRGAMLHCHGGGMVMGMPELSLPVLRQMADTLDIVIVSVDYRLAPEAPFPAPIEDCYAALVWLHANAESLGVDPTRIGVTGESAGGNLAAAVSLMARDRKGPPLLFQNLIYPMLDERPDATDNPLVGAFCWTRASNAFAWQAYLGSKTDGPVSPYAAPARAQDLSGLPPTWLCVGALDLFLDEDLRFVRDLAAAVVPVELVVYPGAFHAFDVAPHAPVAIRARSDRMEALRRAFSVSDQA